jgi:cobalamin biosynthesis protein CobT
MYYLIHSWHRDLTSQFDLSFVFQLIGNNNNSAHSPFHSTNSSPREETRHSHTPINKATKRKCNHPTNHHHTHTQDNPTHPFTFIRRAYKRRAIPAATTAITVPMTDRREAEALTEDGGVPVEEEGDTTALVATAEEDTVGTTPLEDEARGAAEEEETEGATAEEEEDLAETGLEGETVAPEEETTGAAEEETLGAAEEEPTAAEDETAAGEEEAATTAPDEEEPAEEEAPPATPLEEEAPPGRVANA